MLEEDQMRLDLPVAKTGTNCFHFVGHRRDAEEKRAELDKQPDMRIKEPAAND